MKERTTGSLAENSKRLFLQLTKLVPVLEEAKSKMSCNDGCTGCLYVEPDGGCLIIDVRDYALDYLERMKEDGL